VFITINGQRQYVWRAVDQDGDVIACSPAGMGLQRDGSSADS
jgi:hypothetical protein